MATKQLDSTVLLQLGELVAPPELAHVAELNGKHGDSFVFESKQHLLENIFLLKH